MKSVESKKRSKKTKIEKQALVYDFTFNFQTILIYDIDEMLLWMNNPV